MFSPIEKEVVAKRIFSRFLEYKISMISFRIGSKPLWWMPIPLLRISRVSWICGMFTSSGGSTLLMHVLKNDTILCDCDAGTNSVLLSIFAYSVMRFMLKTNITAGVNSFLNTRKSTISSIL